MRECGLWPTANRSIPNKKRDETSVTRSIEDGDATEEYYSVPWHYESGVFLQLEGTDQEQEIDSLMEPVLRPGDEAKETRCNL